MNHLVVVRFRDINQKAYSAVVYRGRQTSRLLIVDHPVRAVMLPHEEADALSVIQDHPVKVRKAVASLNRAAKAHGITVDAKKYLSRATYDARRVKVNP